MILVTGATGNIGREVVNLLLAGGAKVMALTRHPETAALPDGVRVVGADPFHLQILEPELEGIEAILVSPRALGDATAPATTAELLAMAVKRGAPRVVVLSAATVEYGGGEKRFANAFQGVEDATKASGLPWTFLRSTDYASNALAWVPQIRATGVVSGAYGYGATSTVHNRDVAAVSALALMDSAHVGQTYLLSGPQSLTQRDRVRLIGQAIGRELHWQEIQPAQVRQAMLAQGLPPDVPDRLLGYWASLEKMAGPSSTDVSRVLGHPALTFAEWAVEHAAAFQH